MMNLMNKRNSAFSGIKPCGPLFLRAFAPLMLTVLLFLGGATISLAQTPLYPIYVTGTVVDAPNNDSGIGLWLVVDEEVDDIEYSVIATNQTSIPVDTFFSPTIGDNVEVWGFKNDDGSINALSIFVLDPEIPSFDDDYWDNPLDPDDGEDEDDSSDGDGFPNIDIDFDENFDIDIEFDTYWKLVLGVVASAPSNESGEGQWLIVTNSGEEIDALADSYTDFGETIPAVGDRVLLDGFITLDGEFIADQFYLSFDDIAIDVFDGEIEELTGIVISAPTPVAGAETEEWTVETLDAIYTVIISTNTIFEPRRPTVNERINVLGYITDAGFMAQEIALDQFGIGEIIVRLETDTISQTIASRYNLFAESTVLSSGGIYKFASFNPRSQHIQQVVNDMMNDSEIIWAERNVVGGLPVQDEQQRSWAWGSVDAEVENKTAYQQINLDLAHTQYLGDGAVIAVLDTGVDLNHPDLQSHLVQGWDMVDDDRTPNDEGPGMGWGHGTHVSGIVAQVAPNSKIMPIRVLDSNGRGDTFLLAYAIEWAVDHGADVINMSLGVEQYTWVLYNAIQYAAENGVVVVAAAGNSNTGIAQYPAAFAEVVGVAAVDRNNTRATFSNYGDWVSMAAPGVGIRSTIVGKDGDGEIVHSYANWSGTSMAAPFVAGAAALVQQKVPMASSNAVATILRYPNVQHTDIESSALHQVNKSVGTLLDVAAAVDVMLPVQTETTTNNMAVKVYLPAVTQ